MYLVLHELAAGHEVIVSRGELIEIGDGFRIPEIMARSGAMLREVGTTNRTSLHDYREAINAKTRLIMRVHPSNFRVTGFTARPLLKELAELGRSAGIPVYEDLGSGCLMDLRAQGIDEPLVSESVAAAVNLVSFSCDKLLGGPQTGIIAGDAELVARVLLRQDWKALPALHMILASVDQLRQRAEHVCAEMALKATVEKSEAPIGGGSTPDQVLPTWVVKIDVPNPNGFEKRLRACEPPVIARIEHDKIVLDMRTVAEREVDALIAAVKLVGEKSVDVI